MTHKPSVALMDSKILVLGAAGQVGRSIWSLTSQWKNIYFSERAPKAPSPSIIACDLSSPEALRSLIFDVKPHIIINCAAYTAVDSAEKEPILAFAMNETAVAIMAKAAQILGSILIHYSTDYVFDGKGTRPYLESDPTAPVNVYGASKLAGEDAALKYCQQTYILRTQWVYSKTGKNFVNTMLRLGAEREELSVVDDQIGAPTSSDVIARFTLQALDKIISDKMHPGIYNLACRGEVSWHRFAEEIFSLARLRGEPLKVKSIKKISSEDYPTPAKRPLSSRLSLQKIEHVLEATLPTWNQALSEALLPTFKSELY
ncbi:MAG: dTDP-4-dehydrorhamnose reductase [Proteobacteria bacterium]|nr:dTDP-4-dehydrorhamnose reductase [Pseudomonadota bacterium]